MGCGPGSVEDLAMNGKSQSWGNPTSRRVSSSHTWDDHSGLDSPPEFLRSSLT